MFRVNKDASIDIIQGDTGVLYINGIVASQNTNVDTLEMYMSIYNSNNVIQSEEISCKALFNNETFNYDFRLFIPSEFTDDIKVNADSDEEYFYSLKLCYEDIDGNHHEETLTVDGNPDTQTAITIYPKRTEGV